MGLIAGRPEEPTEWAGLPSEPLQAEEGIDRLADAPLAASDAFGLLGGGAIESIVIPVALPTEVAQETDSTPADGPSQS